MTTTQTVLLSPIDAWFFRDGRPYNEGESNQTDVVSLFPPPATTLVGALRAGLARGQKWNGTGRWSAAINDVLGDGFNNLGKLQFCGPWLVRRQDSGACELLFPMPLHVLGKPMNADDDNEPKWQPACLLTPPKDATPCDLGDVRLPVMSAIRAKDIEPNELKEPSSQWVIREGLERILSGQLPEATQVVESRDLWSHEARIGLKRDEASRVTLKGALYSPRFVRLARGVSLAMTVAGLPADWRVPELLALGGEGRMADCQMVHELKLPSFAPNADQSSRQLTVTLLTPMLPPDGEHGGVITPHPNQPFYDWPGTKVVSACIGKPQSLGGWDSLAGKPLPLRPVLPAGSTWFLEVADRDAISQHIARGIGIKTQYGFGQVVLGVWPTASGDTTP